MWATVESRTYWDDAARRAGPWYVSTGHRDDDEEFFAQGAREVDTYLAFCGVVAGADQVALEIGCGVGRMTRRLSQVFGRVIAVDVSEEMLRRCRENLSSFPNVACRAVAGDGSLGGIGDGEVDVVFSYLTFQHVPEAAAQLAYFDSCARVLSPGGKLAVQIRSCSRRDTLLSYLAALGHLAKGRRTLSRPWRGSRVEAPVVVERLRARGVEATVRPWPHHPRWSPEHWWVVGTKS